MSQNARGQTVNIATTRYSRTERYELTLLLMKRIALTLVLCLGATIVLPTSTIFWITILFVQSIHWHNETMGLCSTRGKLSTPLTLRHATSGDGVTTSRTANNSLRNPLMWVPCKRAASPGLLLWTRQRRIYAGSKRGHCTAPKEFFDARYGDTYRPRTARIAHALTRHGGRSSATPNDSPPNTACVLVLTGVRPSICRAVSFIAFPSHRSKPYGAPSLSLRIMRERPCETL